MIKQYFTSFEQRSQTGPRIDLSEFYLMDESRLVSALLDIWRNSEKQRIEAGELASKLVAKIRSSSDRTPVIDAFLQEYGLSTDGLASVKWRVLPAA